MKVVHCIYGFNTGGAETMLIDIVNEQCKTADVTLVVVNKSYDRSLLDKIDRSVRVVLLNRKPGSRSPFPILRFNMLLLRLRPDVIHCHQASLAPIIFPIWKNLVFTAHCMNIPTNMFHRYKRIFAISDAVCDEIIGHGYSNVTKVINGIDVDAIAMRGNERRHSPFHIVQVARLDKNQKGQDILIKAVASLKARGNDDIAVDLIGTGVSLQELQTLAAKCGVESQIRFLGLRDRNYIYAHLKDYDLMCHPSRHEGFGLTVAEAMAARVPVAVSVGDGPFEIIGRGRLGRGFATEDAEACADAIAEIYDNYAVALQCVDDARRHVAENYSIANTANVYLKNYISCKTDVK